MTVLVLEGLSWVLILAGVFFMVVGSIGLLRMPDVYTRLHAAGMTDSIGAGLILLGLALQAGFTLISVRLLLIWAFLLLTNPVGSYALARAARAGRVRPFTVPERD